MRRTTRELLRRVIRQKAMRAALRVMAVLALAPPIAGLRGRSPRPLHLLGNLRPRPILDEARALFEKNIAAIKRRDKAAYLSVYLDSDRLARTSPDGPVLGFAEFAKQAGDEVAGHARSGRPPL